MFKFLYKECPYSNAEGSTWLDVMKYIALLSILPLGLSIILLFWMAAFSQA